MKKNLLTLILLSMMVMFAETLFAVETDNNAAAPDTKPITAPTVPPQAVNSSAPLSTPAPKSGTFEPAFQDDASIDKVIQAAETFRTDNVKSIEFVDGQWEVTTQTGNLVVTYSYDKNTKGLKQAKSNLMTLPPLPSNDMSSLKNAVKAVQDKSSKVVSVNYKDKYWIVKAFDSNGKRNNTSVDVNGHIIKTTTHE